MMTFQLLPHLFKKIGLILFLLAGLPAWSVAFMKGFAAGSGFETSNLDFLPSLLTSHSFTIISYAGLLMYALSKDKVFDELMIKLRLESLYLVFFGTLVFIFIRILIGGDWEMSASYLFEAQVIFYLVINKIRKSVLQ